MLLPIPPKFRKSRSRTKPVNTGGLAITSVITSGSEVAVHFSGPVAWDGVTVPSAFQAFTTDEQFQSCINVTEVGAAFVKLEFNAGVDPGAAWILTGPMAGITPDIAWPQSGTVIS